MDCVYCALLCSVSLTSLTRSHTNAHVYTQACTKASRCCVCCRRSRYAAHALPHCSHAHKNTQALKKSQPMLRALPPLTLRGVHGALRAMAADSGQGSAGRRQAAVAKLLRACRCGWSVY